jgi:hypothetical protein
MKRIATAVLTVMLCGSVSTRPQEYSLEPMLDQFETVFFADAELFRDSGRFATIPKSSRTYLKLPFGLLVAALQQSALTPLDAAISEGKVKGVFVGAREFHVIPRTDRSIPLGPFRFQGCYLLQTVNGSIDLSALLRTTLAGNLEGQPFWRVTFPYSENYSATVVVLQASPEFVLLATDESLAAACRSLAVRSAESTAVLDSTIRANMKGPYWGVRDYRRVQPAPPGAISLDTILGVKPDVGVKNLFLTLRIPDRKAEFFYFTVGTPPEAFDIFKLEKSKASEWKSEVLLVDGNEENLFRVLSLFGFGAAL